MFIKSAASREARFEPGRNLELPEVKKPCQSQPWLKLQRRKQRRPNPNRNRRRKRKPSRRNRLERRNADPRKASWLRSPAQLPAPSQAFCRPAPRNPEARKNARPGTGQSCPTAEILWLSPENIQAQLLGGPRSCRITSTRRKGTNIVDDENLLRRKNGADVRRNARRSAGSRAHRNPESARPGKKLAIVSAKHLGETFKGRSRGLAYPGTQDNIVPQAGGRLVIDLVA